jgi:hypothetical protein
VNELLLFLAMLNMSYVVEFMVKMGSFPLYLASLRKLFSYYYSVFQWLLGNFNGVQIHLMEMF